MRAPIGWAAAVLWIAGVAVALASSRFEIGTGTAAVSPPAWPPASALHRATDRFTAVVFLHPRCPCSRATLSELEHATTACGARLATFVLLARPRSTPEGWERGELETTARAIPGVTVLVDVDEREARLFGARTSGETLLFDASGRLVFSGGITIGRGKAGESTGRRSLVAIVTGENT